MPPKTVPIQTLLLRTLLPAVISVAILLAILVYNWLYAAIVDGFDRKLVTTSALTGAMIDPADHDRLIQSARRQEDAGGVEATPAYRRNADPIRRIRTGLGLTYLYTQAIGGPSSVLYVLDGSEGDDHSTIGSPDELPAETLTGLAKVEREGAIYVSPIEYQEQWGLLKTAAAPVFGVNGGITSSTGADVNISVIRVATQNALFTSAMIGVVSILACILVALRLVRSIASPIQALTQDTLRIAAGDAHELAAAPNAPREVKDLRGALGTLAERTAEDSRHRKEQAAQQTDVLRNAMLARAAGSETCDPVFLVSRADLIVAWIAAEKANARHLLAHTAMARLARAIEAEPEPGREWRAFADLDHGACVVIDRAAGTIELVGAGAPVVVVSDRPVTLRSGSREPLQAGNVALRRAGADDVLLAGAAQ
jgi:hypothetical protein